MGSLCLLSMILRLKHSDAQRLILLHVCGCRYPIIDVRGRGLMVGVEFGGTDSSSRLKAEKGVAMVSLHCAAADNDQLLKSMPVCYCMCTVSLFVVCVRSTGSCSLLALRTAVSALFCCCRRNCKRPPSSIRCCLFRRVLASRSGSFRRSTSARRRSTQHSRSSKPAARKCLVEHFVFVDAIGFEIQHCSGCHFTVHVCDI